jgi:transposase-like protein
VAAAMEPGAVASEVARAAGIHTSQLFRGSAFGYIERFPENQAPDKESHPTRPIQESSRSALRADCVRAGRKRLLRGPGKSPLPAARQGMICKKHDDGADDRHDQTPDVKTGYTFRA